MRARSRATASASKLEQCRPAESERERRGAERAENDSSRSTLAEGRSHRTIGKAGNVRGRKTRVEGGESSKTRCRRTRSRKSEREIKRDKRRRDPGGKGQIRSRRDREKLERERERESERRLED